VLASGRISLPYCPSSERFVTLANGAIPKIVRTELDRNPCVPYDPDGVRHGDREARMRHERRGISRLGYGLLIAAFAQSPLMAASCGDDRKKKTTTTTTRRGGTTTTRRATTSTTTQATTTTRR
jgi:hypothetical protein